MPAGIGPSTNPSTATTEKTLPVDSTPDATGLLTTLIPRIIGGVGLTGAWGSLLNIGSSLLSGTATAANNIRPKAPA